MLQCSLEVATEPGFLMSWELKRCQSLPQPWLFLLGHWEEPCPPLSPLASRAPTSLWPPSSIEDRSCRGERGTTLIPCLSAPERGIMLFLYHVSRGIMCANLIRGRFD